MPWPLRQSLPRAGRFAALAPYVLLTVPIGLGCAMSPIRQVDAWGESVGSITITGNQNLDDRQVQVTDPVEVEAILALIRPVHSLMQRSVSLDIAETEVITVRIDHSSGPTIITMLGGRMLIPNLQEHLFYDGHEETQANLWNLLLDHLAKPAMEPANETGLKEVNQGHASSRPLPIHSEVNPTILRQHIARK